MPQPAMNLQTYIASGLPEIRAKYPPGSGGKVPRPEFKGPLKGISQIKDFDAQVKKYVEATLPNQPVPSHPAHPFPHLTMSARSASIASEQDLIKYLKQIPLESDLATLSALDLRDAPGMSETEGKKGGGEDLQGEDGLGHSSLEETEHVEKSSWKFGSSPLGEVEGFLVDADDKPVMVVRAVTENLMGEADWEEFSVTGPYTYNPKSKASWFWSRQSLGTARVGVKYFVLTSYTYWVFGVFNEDGSFADASHIFKYDATSPSVLEAFYFWSRSALGKEGGYKLVKNPEVEGMPALFPTNPARRGSTVGGKERLRPEMQKVPKKASESDVEDEEAV